MCTDGNPYGIAEGIIFSMPCRSNGDGSYEIVEGLEINDWLRRRIQRNGARGSPRRLTACLTLPGKTGGACELEGAEDTALPGDVSDAL